MPLLTYTPQSPHTSHPQGHADMSRRHISQISILWCFTAPILSILLTNPLTLFQSFFICKFFSGQRIPVQTHSTWQPLGTPEPSSPTPNSEASVRQPTQRPFVSTSDTARIPYTPHSLHAYDYQHLMLVVSQYILRLTDFEATIQPSDRAGYPTIVVFRYQPRFPTTSNNIAD